MTTTPRKTPASRAGKPATKAAKAPSTSRTSKTGAAADVSAEAQKATKPKLVRDSFTIPKAEYAVLEALKLRATDLKRPAKKSEILRAGIASLSKMTDKAFLEALRQTPSLKTGRPKLKVE